MAHHIKTNGQVIPVEPKNGRGFKLEELQGFVAGYIEICDVVTCIALVDSTGAQFGIFPNQVLVVNEEGQILGLQENELASAIAGQYVCGDVLLGKRSQIR